MTGFAPRRALCGILFAHTPLIGSARHEQGRLHTRCQHCDRPLVQTAMARWSLVSEPA
jgi:hypothetical protein